MTSGIYIARNRYQDVLYVGMSKNIEKRLGPHHQKWAVIEKADIEIIPCEISELNVKEKELIEKLKPIYNYKMLLRGENFIIVRDEKFKQPSSEADRIKKQISFKRFNDKTERLCQMFNIPFYEEFRLNVDD